MSSSDPRPGSAESGHGEQRASAAGTGPPPAAPEAPPVPGHGNGSSTPSAAAADGEAADVPQPVKTAGAAASLPPMVQQDGLGAWLDTVTIRASEYLNPILVKETRQALKSRQFLITFSLVLLAGWAWSFGGIALTDLTEGSYRAGQELFVGYLAILGFPLLVIVPFGAFRSLVAEWEDNTYELLSISALKPHQIIRGKLGSSMLQMALYLSAIAPCLGFTYLLRGIDLPTILFMLFWLVAGSVVSTLLGLCVATLARARHWQIVFSVILIAGCLWGFGAYCTAATEALFFGRSALDFNSGTFWAVNGMVLTAAAGYGAMFFLIARAALLFPSENRSTALRICLVVQYLLCMAWAFWIWLFIEPDYEILVGLGTAIAIHWAVTGTFLVGERPELSQRARRQLPQSFLGRMFWMTFNPGSGTGYLFVTANMASATLVLIAAPRVLEWLAPATIAHIHPQQSYRLQQEVTAVFQGMLLCYVIIYLGLTRLTLQLLWRITENGLLMAFLIHVILVAFGSLVPLVIQASAGVGPQYTLLQVFNPFWTLEETLSSNRYVFSQLPTVMFILPVAATAVLLLNVLSLGKELQQLRVDAPQRVVEEDQRLNPQPEPPPYRSPWDEDEAAANLA